MQGDTRQGSLLPLSPYLLDDAWSIRHVIVVSSHKDSLEGHRWRARRVAAVCASAALSAACIAFICSRGSGLGSQHSLEEDGDDLVGPLRDLTALSKKRAALRAAAEGVMGGRWEVQYPKSRGVDGSRLQQLEGMGVRQGDHNSESILQQDGRDQALRVGRKSRTEILASWGIGGGRNDRHEVSPESSSQLWNFPSIRKYQVQTSRENFWPNVDRATREEDGQRSLEWPERQSSGFEWPGGRGILGGRPKMVKAGGFLRRGEILPVTRPYVQWSGSLSS